MDSFPKPTISKNWICLCAVMLSFSRGPVLSSSAVADEPAPASPAAAPQTPKPTPLSKLKLDLTKLKFWGTRKYRLRGFNEDAPPLVLYLKTTVQENAVKFQDRVELTAGPAKSAIDFVIDANLDRTLSLRSFKTDAPTAEDVGVEISGKIADGSLSTTTTVGGETKREQIDAPEQTTTLFALTRIVTLLPRTEGRRYAIDNVVEVDLSPPKTTRAWIIECKGLDETLTLADKKWTLFHLYPAAEDDRQNRTFKFWVDPQGTFGRMSAGPQYFEPIEEEPAPDKMTYIPLGKVKLDYNRLKNWGTRKYRSRPGPNFPKDREFHAINFTIATTLFKDHLTFTDQFSVLSDG